MHKIQLTYDEATGKLTVSHRCAVTLGEHIVSHAEDVALADEPGAVAALKALLDANRVEMEQRTQGMGIQHVAALIGREGKGIKRISLGGSLGAVSTTTTKKLE